MSCLRMATNFNPQPAALAASGRFPATSTRGGGHQLASGAANGPLMAIKSSLNPTQNRNSEVCRG